MICVFKTSVEDQQQVNDLRETIDAYFPDAEWNFDLEDRDRIFRINTNNLNLVISIFKNKGFNCEELSDQILPKF